MFDFLNRIFDYIFQFVPQFEIVGPDEKGIRVTCVPFVRNWCKTLDFGWYIFWPLFQDFYTLNVKPQILVVEITRHDLTGKPIESTWAVQYWSRDVYKTMFEVEDHEERLAAHTIRIIGRCIEEGREPGPDDLAEIRSGVSGFGLWIQDVFKLQHVRARAHKLFLERTDSKLGRVVGSLE